METTSNVINFEEYKGSSSTCELSQSNPVKFMLVRKIDDNTYEELNYWIKCQYYIQDHIWSSAINSNSCVHGYQVGGDHPKDWNWLLPSDDVRIMVKNSPFEFLSKYIDLVNYEAGQQFVRIEREGKRLAMYDECDVVILHFNHRVKYNLPLINMIMQNIRLIKDKYIHEDALKCKRLHTFLRKIDHNHMGSEDRGIWKFLTKMYPVDLNGLIRGLVEATVTNPYGANVEHLHILSSMKIYKDMDEYGYQVHNGLCFKAMLARLFPDQKFGGASGNAAPYFMGQQLTSIRRYVTYEPSEKYLRSVWAGLANGGL